MYRWNSFYDCVEKFVRFKEQIPKICERITNEVKPKTFPKFTKTDIMTYTDYVTCMEPLAKSLDHLQGDNVGLGHVLPTIFNIKHKLSTVKLLNVSNKLIQDSLLSALNERFKDIIKFNEDNKDFIIAAVTNPKFKLSWVPTEHKDFVREMFFKEYSQFQTQTNVPVEKSSNKDDLFGDFLQTGSENGHDATITACEYLKSLRTDLLMLKLYPMMPELHVKYNTTMPSSARVERLFSQALIVFSPRRNRLNATTFERILFVKHNKDLLNK